MARKTDLTSMLGTGSGIGRKIVMVLVGLVVLTLVIRNPVGSANTVVSVWQWASHVIDALSTFGQALSGRS